MRRVSQFITGAAMLGLCVALVGCARPAPPATPLPTPGGSNNHGAEKAHKDAQAFAVHVAVAGDTAQKKCEPSEIGADVKHDAQIVKLEPGKGTATIQPTVSPAPPNTTRTAPVKVQPRPAALVDELVVSSVPYMNEAEADEDAIEQAREIIAKKLAAQDPPIHYKPSANEVRAEYLRKETRNVRAPNDDEKKLLAQLNISGDPKYVEYKIEVTADQVRRLRSQDHISSVMRVVGAVFALALFGFLFLRTDEWTKGYLTSWLALGAFLLAGGAAAALIFI